MEQLHRIMAVDDDPDILELIRLSLMDAYEIFVFQDPIQACKSLEVVEPDMLILDVMMPKMTGYQVVEMIRGHSQFQGATVMFLTAKDSNRDVKYGYSLGASVYLTKPFQPDRLLRNIDVVLSRGEESARPKKRTAAEVENSLTRHMAIGIDPALQPSAHGSVCHVGYPGRDEQKAKEAARPDWMR